MPPTRILAPLSPRVTLGQLLNRAPGAGQACGVWITGPPGPARPLPLRIHLSGTALNLVLSSDLGVLLQRTARVLVRRGSAIVCLDARQLAAGRHLEIVAPDGHSGLLPLRDATPERLLSACAAEGKAVASSRVRYLG